MLSSWRAAFPKSKCLKRCDKNVSFFIQYAFRLAHTYSKTVSVVGSFFQFAVLEILGFEHCQAAISWFCNMVWKSPKVMHQMLIQVRRSRFFFFMCWLKHGFSKGLLVVGIVILPFKCCPSQFLESLTFNKFFTVRFFTFCQLIMSNLTLVSGFEFEIFPTLEFE